MARSLLRSGRYRRAKASARLPIWRAAPRLLTRARGSVRGREGRARPPGPGPFLTLSAADGNKKKSVFETGAHHWKRGGFGIYTIATSLLFLIPGVIGSTQ